MAEVTQKSGGGRTVRDALIQRAKGSRGKGGYIVNYDAKGNLDIRDKTGKFVDHIVMPSYRRVTEDELAEMFEQRAAAIHEAEETIEQLMPELRGMITKYKAIGESDSLEDPVLLSDILLMNQQLQTAYAQYTLAEFPEKELIEIDKQPVKLIQLNERCIDTKTPYKIKRLYSRRIPLEDRLVRTAPPEAEEEVTEEAMAEATLQVPGERYTIFRNADETNGFLSPDAPVDFIWKGTAYTSVRQAIEYQKALATGKAGLAQTIMRATTSLRAKTLGKQTTVKGAESGLKISQEILIDIVRASFAVAPERAQQLKATGESTLVFAEEEDRVLGVGRDPAHAQRSQWQGENLYGKALAVVREDLMPTNPFDDGEEVPTAAAGSAAKKATVGGIIAQRRKAPTFVRTAAGPF